MKSNGTKRPGDMEITGFWFTLFVVWPAAFVARVTEWVNGR